MSGKRHIIFIADPHAAHAALPVKRGEYIMSSGDVEVRAFSFIKEIFDKRGWSLPLRVTINEQCSPAELAQILELPEDKIEAVFINGTASPMGDDKIIKPGDRVAFVPPGTPGPYRAIMGLTRIPGDESKTN